MSATTLRNDIFRSYYDRKAAFIKYFATWLGFVSATTDLWTSGYNIAMIAVPVAWLTADFVMKEATIGFRELNGDHSGTNIAAAFYSVLKEFNLQDRVINFLFLYYLLIF